MRRTILIALLAFGTVAGFGAEALTSTCHRNSCHSRRE
jgi:hypothetical protein